MNENKKHVLIIEDDEHITKVYEAKFFKEGIATTFARNGEEGLIKIVEEKPSLVLLDLMIPGKDGFAVLEEIKKNPEVSNIPVLVLSNLGQQTDKDRALELGAKDYLVKVNFSMQEVIDKAKSYL